VSQSTIRRVVLNDVDGSTRVEETALSFTVESPTTAITDVWVTADSGAVDRAPGDAFELLPPDGGATWRIVEFKAGTAGPDLSRGMHSTPTADMGIVASGEVLLVLEDLSTVRLTAGDTFVLRGNQHTWANDTDQSCVVALVLVRRDCHGDRRTG
jgi:quercetin dioxygenase-like cupin family protein